MAKKDLKDESKPVLERNDSDMDFNRTPIPGTLPILPLRGTVIYPTMVIPLLVAREKSIRMINEVLDGDQIIGLVAQKNPEEEDPAADDIYSIGIAAQIIKLIKMPDNSVRIMIEGLGRIRIKRFVRKEPYFIARVEKITERFTQSLKSDALIRNIRGLFKDIVSNSPNLPKELNLIIQNISEPGKLADIIASSLNLTLEERQEILTIADITKRLERVHVLLNREQEILKLGNKIQSQIKDEMDKAQREYYLRQQMRALQKELGETDDRTVEIEELGQRIEQANLPGEAYDAAVKELDRLKRMPPAAAEYTVSRTYLDWILELPWSISTEDNLDTRLVQNILDQDHFGLEKVKKRIVEYIAVRHLKKDMKGPILCFVGPPGTGKTSLGKSIARAMDRKFHRISVGGVKDEAEIRGHRRTYVGALPGRIIQGLRKAGARNPVFMLDEVDKIGMDFRGDPASALLEVLDPEQNFSFSDHYLDLTFDLSKVMFITTANIIETIPPALKDRMEVMYLTGYTHEEKIEIARRHLIPRQLNEHGLTSRQLQFRKSALMGIIQSYTREAGVRNLEREIAAICRAVAREVVEGRKEVAVITADRLSFFLGPVKVFPELGARANDPGVAIGLAYTPSGGDILYIEATRMPGKKSITLTGQLGEVMKESAQAAISYVRSIAHRFDIPDDYFESSDLHIHVPEGAVPKDGPSAGVTIATALVSLLANRTVAEKTAMTGEITLRGHVLPVGGIKEKTLAAYRAGINTVILPKKNEKDLEEIPDYVRQKVQFVFVSKVDEVLRQAIPASAENGAD
ncbi:endopeptidase La [bacterium]|nr:endopeptidase La [candidate division CSSED10-310 bacterium]